MNDGERARLRAFTDLVLADVERLTDLLVRRILDAEPAYRQLSVVALQDLRQSCKANLDDVVSVLRDQVPQGVDIYASAAATGRRRASQGMPLHAVLHSYSLGGRVILDAVAEAALSQHPSLDSGALLHVAIRVWEAMDRFSTTFAAAYRDEELRLQREHRHQQQRDVTALIRGDVADEELAAVTHRLGFGESGRFAAIVILADDPSLPQFSIAAALEAHGVHSCWAVSAWRGIGTEIGLVSLAEADTDMHELVRLAKAGATSRTGVSAHFSDLRDAGGAVHLAQLTAMTLDRPTAVAVYERLPQVLLLDAPELSELLLKQTVDRLGKPGPDREALLQTVDALLRAGGSQAAAAIALYCHRNTVRYRLRRIVELSGHDPATAEGALLWALSLQAAAHSVSA